MAHHRQQKKNFFFVHQPFPYCKFCMFLYTKPKWCYCAVWQSGVSFYSTIPCTLLVRFTIHLYRFMFIRNIHRQVHHHRPFQFPNLTFVNFVPISHISSIYIYSTSSVIIFILSTHLPFNMFIMFINSFFRWFFTNRKPSQISYSLNYIYANPSEIWKYHNNVPSKTWKIVMPWNDRVWNSVIYKMPKKSKHYTENVGVLRNCEFVFFSDHQRKQISQ